MAGCFSVHKVRSVADAEPASVLTDSQYIPLQGGVDRDNLVPEYNRAGILTEGLHSTEYLFVAPEDWKQWAQELDNRAKPGGRSFVRDTIEVTHGYTRMVVIGPGVCAALADQIHAILAATPDKRPRWACFAAHLQEYFSKAAEQKAILLVN